MDQIILEVEDLKTRFHLEDGVVAAVNGISYSVREGETLGIVGESGCGKTVSVLSILRLLPEPPAEIGGSVRFNGEELLELSADKMRRVRGSQIGIIFQDPMTSLNPVLTIGYQLMEPLKLHMEMDEAQARSQAAALLKLVGIPDPAARLDDYPHNLSGGMRQRVMIAMALACSPSLLIADEPTTALDVTIQAQLIELVKDLRDKLGMSLIWITHDLGIIAGLADRVLVMYAGYIVEQAPVDEFYTNPQHPYSASLLKSLPRMKDRNSETLDAIDGKPPDLSDLPDGCPFLPRCEFALEICGQINPPLVQVGAGHTSACWVDMRTRQIRPEMTHLLESIEVQDHE